MIANLALIVGHQRLTGFHLVALAEAHGGVFATLIDAFPRVSSWKCYESWYSNKMSSRNGDKARHGRLRKIKLARRVRMETLKAELAAKKPVEKEA